MNLLNFTTTAYDKLLTWGLVGECYYLVPQAFKMVCRKA